MRAKDGPGALAGATGAGAFHPTGTRKIARRDAQSHLEDTEGGHD
jgi:hypothetical protein